MSSRGKATAKGSAGWPSTSRRPLSPPWEESPERGARANVWGAPCDWKKRQCGGRLLLQGLFPLSSPVTLASCHTLSLPTLPCSMEKQQGRTRFFPIGSIPDVSFNPYTNTHTSCIKSGVQTGERCRGKLTLPSSPLFCVLFTIVPVLFVFKLLCLGEMSGKQTFRVCPETRLGGGLV